MFTTLVFFSAHTHTHTHTHTQDGYCMINQSVCGVKLSGFTTIPSGDENSLVMAIAVHGPIGVAIDASHKSFSFYSHGVYYDPACGECRVLCTRTWMHAHGDMGGGMKCLHPCDEHPCLGNL